MKPYEGVWNKPGGDLSVASFEAYQAARAQTSVVDAQKDVLLTELETLQDRLEGELEAIGDGRTLTTAQRIGALSEIRKIVEFKAVLQGLVTPDQSGKVF